MNFQFNHTNFPHFHLSLSVGKFLSDNRENVTLQELTSSLRKNRVSLLNPMLLRGKNPADRQKVESGSIVVDGRPIPISPEIRAEIFKMSDEMELNEMKCFNYWCNASSTNTRRTLERVLGLQPGSLKDDIPNAARQCQYMERLFLLNALCELLKARMDSTLSEAKKDILMHFTNQLLVDGLIGNLIKGILDLAKPVKNSGLWRKKLAECLFYICYQTQLEDSEAQAFVKLLRSCSKELNTLITQQQPPASTLEDPILSLFETLYILQITFMCIFEQTHALINRRTGQETVDNQLIRNEFMDSLHVMIFSEPWEHKGFQGITLLIWSIVLHRSSSSSSSSSSSGKLNGSVDPSVVIAIAKDLNTIQKKVAELKTFTFLSHQYISFLPDDQVESKVFYIDMLEEIALGYIETTLVHPKEYKLPDTRTKSVFTAQLAGDSSSTEICHPSNEDCLEEVVDFFIELGKQNPTFASHFWDSAHPLHSFLLALLGTASKDVAFSIPYMRLIASVAVTNECAMGLYRLTQKHPSRLSWSHIFTSIKRYHQYLSAPEFSSGYGGKIAIPRMRNDEVRALEAILNVLQAVLQVPSVRSIFYQSHEYAPLLNLFALLRCAIPTRLKGVIMRTIAVFAKSPEIALQIWQFVEHSQLLVTLGSGNSSSSSSSSYNHNNSNTVNTGIKCELEQIESLDQEYPSTFGFITLMKELMLAGCPITLGIEHRIPGDFPYTDFLKTNVFLKFDTRAYRCEEEKWKITSVTLSIFKDVLQRYLSLPLSTREEEFNVSYVDCPGLENPQEKPKSFGFQLMQLFLTESPFLKKILLILTGYGGVRALLAERRNHIRVVSSQDDTTTSSSLQSNSVVALTTHSSSSSPSTTQSSSSSSPYRDLSSPSQQQHAQQQHAQQQHAQQQHAQQTHAQQQASSTRYSSSSNFSPYADPMGFHEKCVLLCLEMLDLVMEHDDVFVETSRTRSCGILLEPLHVTLLRSPKQFVSILQYIQYNKMTCIPRLACQLLYKLSMNLNPQVLVNVLEDNGGSQFLIDGYVSQLVLSSFLSSSSPTRKEKPPLVGVSDHDAGTPEEVIHMGEMIVDLLIQNLTKPAPNLSHLLLGLTEIVKPPATSSLLSMTLPSASPNASTNCLQAIMEILYSPNFFQNHDVLAESCYRLIYMLCSQTSTSKSLLRFLRRDEYDFFYYQLQKLPLHLPKEMPHSLHISLKNSRAWLLKGASLELHLTATCDPPLLERNRRLFCSLFTSEQSRIPMLELLESTSLVYEAPVLPLVELKELAMESTVVNAYGNSQKYLSIDIKKFHQNLEQHHQHQHQHQQHQHQQQDPLAMEQCKKVLEWGLRWNSFSENVAATCNLLSSWREITEIGLFECLNVLEKVGSSEEYTSFQGDLLYRLLEAILKKLTTLGVNPEISPILASITLSLICQLRERGQSQGIYLSLDQCQNVLNGLMIGICRSNLTSNTTRGILYACLIHYFRYTLPEQENLLFQSNAFTVERYADELVQFIAKDTICGDVLYKTLAFSLVDVIASFNPSQAIRRLYAEGHIQSFLTIFHCVPTLDKQDEEAQATLAIFESVCSFLTRIAKTLEGAKALLEYDAIGYMRRCTALHTRPRPRWYPSKNNSFSSTFSDYSLAGERYQQCWMPCLRLVNALLECVPTNVQLAEQAIGFVELYHKSFSFALNDEIHTLDGLREVGLVCAILSKLAGFHDPFEKQLGRYSLKYTRLILHLLKKYGTHPFPKPYYATTNTNIASSSLSSACTTNLHNKHAQQTTTWWSSVVPSKPSERIQAETLLPPPLFCESSLTQTTWSEFDAEKLLLSQMILCNALAFCRNRMLSKSSVHGGEMKYLLCPPWKDQVPKELAYGAEMRLSDVVECLIDCAKRLSSGTKISKNSQHTTSLVSSATKSPLDLAEQQQEDKNASLFAVENFLVLFCCHMHHFLSMETTNQKVLMTMVQSVVDALDGLEDYSFIYSLARKLKEIQVNSVVNH